MSLINTELLKKYFSGQCTPEEEEAVHQWLDENDIEAYPEAAKGKTGKQMDRNWLRLTRRVEELKPFVPAGKRQGSKKWLKIAAVFTGAIVLAAAIYYFNAGHTLAKYQTNYGEVKQVMLEDGTMVTLNAQSTLTVKSDFGKKTRKVYLEGEAYFQVKHHPGSPFIVNAGRLSVTALGTAFDVSAFPEDSAIAVSLKEGKVLVKTDAYREMRRQDIILRPGEEVIYRKNTADVQVEKFDPQALLAWQGQVIYFENADILDVLNKLERFYGVTFDTHLLKPRHWRLTGEYKNQTLQDVLESLSFNYNLKYKIEDKKVILYEQ